MNAPARIPVAPGEDNALRLRRALWGDARALDAVRGLGLSDATIRRFGLGLKEPYVSRSTGLVVERALAFPVAGADGARGGRWAYLNLDGVTANPAHPLGWGPGRPRPLYSRVTTPGSAILVVPDPVDLWLLSQTLGDAYGSIVIACPSQPGDAPAEWRDPLYWRGWSRVVLGLSARADEEDLAAVIGRAAHREVARCTPAAGEAWADLVRTGGSAAEIRSLLDMAAAWSPVAPVRPDQETPAGDFAADPVAIEGGIVRGLMHYPVTVERREVERDGVDGVAMVQRYVTRVLRADGAMLDVERLPAPRGTPAAGRVLALSDGTRIVSAPRPAHFGTWRYASINAFVEARAEGREPDRRRLGRIVADVEAHLRSCVWLPHGCDFALAALFVAATFVHRAFDAFPILLVNGDRGTGKSELGQALASVACNAVVAGRITPAGLVRLLAESRGTVILDDLEAIGSGRAGDEVAQVLKTSYKASTARRVAPGRDGRVEVVDYFAPKVVTNISGADPVLLSRMLAVRTGRMPADHALPVSGIEIAALRDELHVWAMCEATHVAKAHAVHRDAARDRRAEIAAPLRALADLAGGGTLAERLEEALAAEPDAVAEPVEELLGRALRRLVAEEGAVEVAMPRLALEMAVLARGPFELPSAEALGRLLLRVGARTADGRVDRRRLHGQVVRVYGLADRWLAAVGRPAVPPPEPFAFCTGPCQACPYDDACDAAAPGLRRAKFDRA